jgi:hypothetical protein
MWEDGKGLELIGGGVEGLEGRRRVKKGKYRMSDIDIGSLLGREIKAEVTERGSRSRLMSDNNLGNLSSRNLGPTKASIVSGGLGWFTSQKTNLVKTQKSGFGKYSELELQDLRPASVSPKKNEPKRSFC